MTSRQSFYAITFTAQIGLSNWQWGHAFAKEMRPQVFILSKNGLERGKIFDFYDCGNF